MNNLKQYETSQRVELLALVQSMNILHATMGGRDKRPERVALIKCMRILRKEIDYDNRRKDQVER